MSLAVSTTDQESRAARLYRPDPPPRLDPETARTASAAIDGAIAALHAEPGRYAHLTAAARAEFICDAARAAVRAHRAARMDGPESVP